MDMDFRGQKKIDPKDEKKVTREIPGFRGSSELPEHADANSKMNVTEDEIASAFGDSSEDQEKTSVVTTPDPSRPLTDIRRPLSSPFKPQKRSKKKHIIILLIILGLVVMASVGWLLFQKRQDNKDKSGEVQTSQSEQPSNIAPELQPAPLTGVDVSPETASLSTLAVMIENSTDARPQSGLSEADMVYEAVAEGGITRFIALFQSKSPTQIGPIRSARPYYVDIARTFDASYIHAGGSDDALARVSELGIKDMSAFENNGTYERVDFRDAPHDLYSSGDKLRARANQLGQTTSTFTPWNRKNDTPQTPTASQIDFSISSSAFNASFSYDQVTNSYVRSVGGEPHLDLTTKTQLAPKVVVALVTSKGQDGIYSTYRLDGSGEILVFQDGIVSTGTWSKESPAAQFTFKDKNGLPFGFNKGQVWISLLDSTADAAYIP